MTLLDKINKTIKYAHRFGGKLTIKQLYWRLLTDKKYSLEEIKNTTSNLKLKTSKDVENNKKIKLAKELVLKHLFKFNNILMVGVTGSVAAENAKKNEDIDLLIICKGGTLWLTRLLVRIYIKINKIPHRKWGHKEKSNDFCFNLWLDENNLAIPKLKQNQKNAVDLIMMKVMLDRNNIYKKFIEQNDWAEKYVANGYNQIKTSNFKLQTSKTKTGIIMVCLNYLAFLGQLLYIRLKGPVKFINLNQAFFHK
jgi:predicted nucleotidyltransferase